METRHLRAVLAVAAHKSFTLAAQEMFLSQSSVSRQVAALERQLGKDLFLRDAKSVTLTTAGAAFLPHARKILEAVGTAESVARGDGLAPGPVESATVGTTLMYCEPNAEAPGRSRIQPDWLDSECPADVTACDPTGIRPDRHLGWRLAVNRDG